MIEIQFRKKNHRPIIRTCISALKKGKAVVYPTDTSYGLAVDATNIRAIRKLYKIKGRKFNKPVHVVAPSVAYAKNFVRWNSTALKLAKKFWPGPLTLVLPVVKGRDLSLRRLSADTGFLGIRMPNNKIALDLSRALKHPITATSANKSGRPDCYSADDVIKQFETSRHKPDIIINAGRLPRRRPSTVVKLSGHQIEILRQGPVRISVQNP